MQKIRANTFRKAKTFVFKKWNPSKYGFTCLALNEACATEAEHQLFGDCFGPAHRPKGYAGFDGWFGNCKDKKNQIKRQTALLELALNIEEQDDEQN